MRALKVFLFSNSVQLIYLLVGDSLFCLMRLIFITDLLHNFNWALFGIIDGRIYFWLV